MFEAAAQNPEKNEFPGGAAFRIFLSRPTWAFPSCRHTAISFNNPNGTSRLRMFRLIETSMNTPTNGGLTLPGLLVRYRYGHGESSHIWSYVSHAKRMESARHLAAQTHCMAVDLCQVRQSKGLTTGCKAFDSQSQGPIPGNVVSNTLLGQYIRPRQELTCNGYDWKPGQLQQADLRAFATIDRQGVLRRYIEKSAHFEWEGGIAYMPLHMRNRDGRHRPVVHGALVTDYHHKRLLTLSAQELGVNGSPKSAQVMAAFTPFLTDEIASDLSPFYRAAALT